MLSGKVIKGINAGNVVFHHRTMQIIARQQTICWQWPFFLSLRDTGLSTLANTVVQEHGGKQLMGLGFRFWLHLSAGFIQTLDVDVCGCSSGPLPGQLPQKGTWRCRPAWSHSSLPSTALIRKQAWRKVLLPPKPALPSPAVPGVTARAPLWD